MIVLDFDDTITDTDTIKYLSEIPYHRTPGLAPPFSHFTATYLTAYEKFKANVGAPSSFEEEIKYQQQLKPVEMSSIAELESHKLFKGITKQDILKQSHKVPIKPGFVSFLSLCTAKNIPIRILSVNWSKTLILAVLHATNVAHHIRDRDIFVNDLQFENGKCTGVFDSKSSIRTGYDKLEVIKTLKHPDSSPPSKLIYIGDSRTDLLPLLASDVGIVMKSGSLNVPWVQEKTFDWRRGLFSMDRGVYRADWEEICKSLDP